MKRMCAFLFSGTGMTEYVTSKIKLEFEKHQICVDIYSIETIQMQSIPFNAYDTIAIAYPVHSFNVPKIMIDVVKQLPKVNSVSAFVISTAGEDHPVNFASSRLLRKLLCQKGFDVFYDKQFKMPSNFVVKYDKQQVKQLMENVNAEIPRIIQDIMNTLPYEQKAGLPAKFMTFIGRAEWFGSRFIGKSFYTNKNCNRCGVCVENCPNYNISISSGRIRFKWHCGLCMRCLYLCPKHAINVHHPFKFIAFEEWYANNELPVARRKQK